jgi:phenylacetate-CoA ligase
MAADATGMHNPAVEARDPAAQRRRDRTRYPKQIAYLFERSTFYRDKLAAAGFKDAAAVGGLDDVAALPFTEKDELRRSQADHPPLGSHAAATWDEIIRVYSTSGTSGDPCFIAVTPNDLAMWTEISARSYAACGIRHGRRVVHNYGAGPFVAGAVTDTLTRAGVTHIPVGTGNTERYVNGIRKMSADAIMATPSFALYLIDWLEDRGIDPATLGIARIALAGEPGGGDPVIRNRIENTFACKSNEAMGIGDISVSLWGECDAQAGMHFGGRDFVHVELIDPDSGAALPFEDGAEGELVYTALRREAMPLLRFRSRDHVRVNAQPCACGRSAVRVRCIGRTDDMLIVRGVNLFPTALRSIVTRFAPHVGEVILIRPTRRGVKQEPPLPVQVELAPGMAPPADLAARIEAAVRAELVVSVRVELVPHSTLPRSEYKSKLVGYADDAG